MTGAREREKKGRERRYAREWSTLGSAPRSLILLWSLVSLPLSRPSSLQPLWPQCSMAGRIITYVKFFSRALVCIGAAGPRPVEKRTDRSRGCTEPRSCTGASFPLSSRVVCSTAAKCAGRKFPSGRNVDHTITAAIKIINQQSHSTVR